MKYYVCHQYGISNNYNTFEFHPWHGVGQGTADAALHYIALSDSLIDAYHSYFQPRILHDPTLTMQIIKSIKAFIDDVVMLTGDSETTFQQLVKRTQNQLQWWNGLVQSSGGALNPTKCCGAFYCWQPNQCRILQLTNPDPNESVIKVTPDAMSQSIPTLKFAQGTRYLGVYLTCNGSTKPMKDHMWKKAITYTRAFQHTHMS